MYKGIGSYLATSTYDHNNIRSIVTESVIQHNNGIFAGIAKYSGTLQIEPKTNTAGNNKFIYISSDDSRISSTVSTNTMYATFFMHSTVYNSLTANSNNRNICIDIYTCTSGYYNAFGGSYYNKDQDSSIFGVQGHTASSSTLETSSYRTSYRSSSYTSYTFNNTHSLAKKSLCFSFGSIVDRSYVSLAEQSIPISSRINYTTSFYYISLTNTTRINYQTYYSISAFTKTTSFQIDWDKYKTSANYKKSFNEIQTNISLSTLIIATRKTNSYNDPNNTATYPCVMNMVLSTETIYVTSYGSTSSYISTKYSLYMYTQSTGLLVGYNRNPIVAYEPYVGISVQNNVVN